MVFVRFVIARLLVFCALSASIVADLEGPSSSSDAIFGDRGVELGPGDL